MDLATMNESQLFPAVVRTEIDYRSPAKLGDLVVVEASLREVGKVRVTCAFSLSVSPENGEKRAIAEATQVVALVQMPSGKPRRTPDKWKRLL